MPWKAKSGKEYKLCLLDTNAISEILKNPKVEGRGYIEKFPPSTHVPCFTIYNFIELRRNQRVYQKFLNFFSHYPIFLTKTQSMILNEEIRVYNSNDDIIIQFNAFTPLGKDDSYNLRLFIEKVFENEQIRELETSWRKNETETLNNWIATKNNFIPSNKYPNTNDAEKYIEQAGLPTLMRLEMNWCKRMIEKKMVPDIDKFHSVKIMLYSLYYRLYDPSWKAKPSEVTDISIISTAPYVDTFVTEKFQVNIMKKIKNKVKNLNKLEIKRIRDIR